MVELEFSMMTRGPDTLGIVQAALKPFEVKNHVKVHVNLLTWEASWTELVKAALYGHGPDVSEIGSTWVGNLVVMNALRPFGAADITTIGNPESFLASIWQSGQAGTTTQWAIPWMVDTRVIYYRRDLLQKIGVDGSTVFDFPASMTQALDRLRDIGVEIPWVTLTNLNLVTLHTLASWVWNAGGDFMSPDGKIILFNRPEAIAGMKDYFGLYRYFASQAPNLATEATDILFQQGRAAVTLSGPWTWMRRSADPELNANTGLVLPRIPFIGGSHLVVWQHSHQSMAVLDLIRYLTSQAVQVMLWPGCGLLSARADVSNMVPFGEAPLKQLSDRLKLAGRAFPSLSMWGLVEDKLKTALHAIWTDILAGPEPDVEAIIHQHIDPLAQRLNTTLGR